MAEIVLICSGCDIVMDRFRKEEQNMMNISINHFAFVCVLIIYMSICWVHSHEWNLQLEIDNFCKQRSHRYPLLWSATAPATPVSVNKILKIKQVI